MIPSTTSVFPSNAIAVIKTNAQLLDSDLFVTSRPLRETDPVQSVGVYGQLWRPDEGSYEMRGGPAGRSEPSLQSYLLSVQTFVKDMDEERGLATHSVLSKMVRSMLYRSDALRVGLLALTVVMNSSTEHTTRFGIKTQRYVSNELQGSWLFMSTLEFWLETETV